MPVSFKQRFLSGLPETPPELDLQLDEFTVFESTDLPGLNDNAKRLLVEEGLPRTASPFLSFSCYGDIEINDLRESGAIPEQFVPLGQNGSGDLLGIDTTTNEVVYLNHDSHNHRVFINSTLDQFLECLCIFQEHLYSKTRRSPLSAIAKIDPRAAEKGAMWHAEAIFD